MCSPQIVSGCRLCLMLFHVILNEVKDLNSAKSLYHRRFFAALRMTRIPEVLLLDHAWHLRNQYQEKLLSEKSRFFLRAPEGPLGCVLKDNACVVQPRADRVGKRIVFSSARLSPQSYQQVEKLFGEFRASMCLGPLEQPKHNAKPASFLDD